MSDDTYEGWSNRETWAIQLHLSNNEGDYRTMQEHATEIVSETDEINDDGETFSHRRDDAVFSMAEFIEIWTSEVFDMVVNPEDGPPSETARMFVSDVGSWWRADFHEIAEHWIDDVLENVVA